MSDRASKRWERERRARVREAVLYVGKPYIADRFRVVLPMRFRRILRSFTRVTNPERRMKALLLNTIYGKFGMKEQIPRDGDFPPGGVPTANGGRKYVLSSMYGRFDGDREAVLRRYAESMRGGHLMVVPEHEKAVYYDLCSSFPTCMTSPKPLLGDGLEEAAAKDLLENLPERFVEYSPRAEMLAEEISKAIGAAEAARKKLEFSSRYGKEAGEEASEETLAAMAMKSFRRSYRGAKP